MNNWSTSRRAWCSRDQPRQTKFKTNLTTFNRLKVCHWLCSKSTQGHRHLTMPGPNNKLLSHRKLFRVKLQLLRRRITLVWWISHSRKHNSRSMLMDHRKAWSKSIKSSPLTFDPRNSPLRWTRKITSLIRGVFPVPLQQLRQLISLKWHRHLLSH